MPSKSAVLPFVGVSSQGSLRSRSFRSRVKGTRFFARDAIPYTENSSRYRSCCSSESRTESVASCTKGIFRVMLELRSSRITKETDSRSRSQYKILCSTPSSNSRKSSFFKLLATPPLSSKTMTGTCTSSTLAPNCTGSLACACVERLAPSQKPRARNRCVHLGRLIDGDGARTLRPDIETREAPTGFASFQVLSFFRPTLSDPSNLTPAGHQVLYFAALEWQDSTKECVPYSTCVSTCPVSARVGTRVVGSTRYVRLNEHTN